MDIALSQENEELTLSLALIDSSQGGMMFVGERGRKKNPSIILVFKSIDAVDIPRCILFSIVISFFSRN